MGLVYTGIFTCIDPHNKKHPNVGKYAMDPMGTDNIL